MGPSIAILLPEWRPAQVQKLRESVVENAAQFDVYTERDGECWVLRSDFTTGAPEIIVTLSPDGSMDSETATLTGWKPQGYVEVRGRKRRDIRPTVQAVALVAYEIADQLGGVVVLNDSTVATAAEFDRLRAQADFEIAGFPSR